MQLVVVADPSKHPLGELVCSNLLSRVTDSGKVAQFASLLKTKLAGKGFRLLYTWTRDGRSNASFHQRCDNQVRGSNTFFLLHFCNGVVQGPTLVIVRSTTGHTFGAFASAPWTSAGGYSNISGCFLFLVENPHNDAPTLFECTNVGNSMYGASTHGPSFGGGHDLTLHPGGDGGQCYANFPHSYADTLARGNATFTGVRNFTVEDYEVWAVS